MGPHRPARKQTQVGATLTNQQVRSMVVALGEDHSKHNARSLTLRQHSPRETSEQAAGFGARLSPHQTAPKRVR